MKHFTALLLVAVLSAQLISCKKEAEQSKETEKPALQYVVKEEGSSVQWTAYKTSDRVAVKGTFKEVRIATKAQGADASGALDGLDFEIPVSSIMTNDTIRDGKLQNFFFAVMENSLTLKGKFRVESEGSGNLAISMNGMSRDLPFTYQVDQDTIKLEASMDLNNWGAQTALESLNEACKELHTGPDGVSKTWNDVTLNAKILVAQE